jgi:pimeloyl-ACP methyl ester carboxylesterase
VSGAKDVELSCPHDPPLAATLVLPAKTPAPTAIIAVGAQMWDRWGDLPEKQWGHYRDVARALQAAGAAALVFDKGGTGATGGPARDVTGRADEVEAAVACARARPEVGPIWLIGHSQGSAVVVQAAATVKPAGMVLLSPIVPPPAGAVAIQAEAESNPAWSPIVIPGASHLLMPEPAEAGVSHVDPRALRAVVAAVVGP